MSKRPVDHRSVAEWTAIAESAAQKLSAAPPRSLRAIVEMNLSNIELRLTRGWSISHLVQELADAGIKTTVPVFKNTLYRLRQKAGKNNPAGRPNRSGALQPSFHDRPGPTSVGETGTPIFKAKADTKNHF